MWRVRLNNIGFDKPATIDSSHGALYLTDASGALFAVNAKINEIDIWSNEAALFNSARYLALISIHNSLRPITLDGLLLIN